MPGNEVSKAHSSHVHVCQGASSFSIARGHQELGAVNGVRVSWLLDTGAAVTLLHKDVWAQVKASNPQKLKPWTAMKLVSAGGTPLTIHGSAQIEVELEGQKYPTEVVVVSTLTSEATCIIGLDF